MSLTLITGRANAGKTGLLHGPLIEAARAGDRAVLLLPTNADVVRARAELSERIAVGIEVATLDGWAADLWSKVGDGRRFITPAVRLAVCSSIAEGATTGPLSSSARTPGFARLLSEIAARSAGLAIESCERPDDQELERLLRDYSHRVNALGLIEPGDALASMPSIPTQSSGVVSINRFFDLSLQQERFVRHLASAADVRISLTWESGFPATEALDPLVSRLLGAGARHIHLPAPAPDTELMSVEERLFGAEGALDSDGRVDFIEASGPEAEIAATADKARRLIESGTSPDRVAIVFRRLEGRWNNLEAALVSQGIDCSVEVSVPFGSSPFGRTLLDLASAAVSRRGERESIVAYLSGPFSDLPADVVHQLDVSWRKRRACDTDEMLSAAARGETYVAKAISALRRIARGETAGILWETLADALRSASLMKARSDAAVSLDAGAHAAFLAAVAALSEAGESLVAQNVVKACQGIMVSTVTEESTGGVVVTDVRRIRARRFDAVILGGLTAAEFSPEHTEPLSVAILSRCGLDVGTDERLAERMLFYSVVTKPRISLTLVRQSTDSRGEPLRASVFWEETLSLYERDGVLAPGVLPTRLSMSSMDRATPAFSVSRRDLRSRALSGELRPPVPSRGALKSLSLGVGPEDEFTVTEVETYVACPYRWFYDRVVRPKNIDREFDVRERGSAAHRIMSAVYGRLRDMGHARVTAQNLADARAVLREESETLLASGEYPLLGLAEELDWARTVRGCESIIEQDVEFLHEFQPVLEEWSFGDSVGRPYSFAGVRFRGVADRIDRGSHGLIVTDYKSSSSVEGQSGFLEKGRFQLLIYANAASHHLGLPTVGGLYRSLASRAIAGFWNADEAEADPEIRRVDTVDTARIEELTGSIGDSVRQAVQGMCRGDIAPLPRKDACKYCGAADFCEASR